MDAAGKIAAELAEGQVDAIMGFFHDQGPTIEAKTGKEVDYLLYADSGLNCSATGFVVNERRCRTRRGPGAGKLVAATQKSWAEAAKDAAGAADGDGRNGRQRAAARRCCSSSSSRR